MSSPSEADDQRAADDALVLAEIATPGPVYRAKLALTRLDLMELTAAEQIDDLAYCIAEAMHDARAQIVRWLAINERCYLADLRDLPAGPEREHARVFVQACQIFAEGIRILPWEQATTTPTASISTAAPADHSPAIVALSS